MAVLSIASASSGGKSAYDRAAILREAHATARWQVAAYRKAGSNLPYRKAFASALRSAWRVAKDRAEDAAYEASLPPIPADVAEHARQMVADAWYEPITAAGNERYGPMLAEASLMREAARAAFHV